METEGEEDGFLSVDGDPDKRVFAFLVVKLDAGHPARVADFPTPHFCQSILLALFQTDAFCRVHRVSDHLQLTDSNTSYKMKKKLSMLYSTCSPKPRVAIYVYSSNEL